jgi:hypothetical protein
MTTPPWAQRRDRASGTEEHAFDRLLVGHADQHGPRRGGGLGRGGRGNRALGRQRVAPAAVRFHTQTLKPRSSRRAAIAAPIAPSPITSAGCWRAWSAGCSSRWLSRCLSGV